MEDVTIKQKDTILGGVLDEYDVNVIRLAIRLAQDYCEDSFQLEDRESLVKADTFLKDVIIKSKTAGR